MSPTGTSNVVCIIRSIIFCRAKLSLSMTWSLKYINCTEINKRYYSPGVCCLFNHLRHLLVGPFYWRIDKFHLHFDTIIVDSLATTTYWFCLFFVHLYHTLVKMTDYFWNKKLEVKVIDFYPVLVSHKYELVFKRHVSVYIIFLIFMQKSILVIKTRTLSAY